MQQKKGRPWPSGPGGARRSSPYPRASLWSTNRLREVLKDILQLLRGNPQAASLADWLERPSEDPHRRRNFAEKNVRCLAGVAFDHGKAQRLDDARFLWGWGSTGRG
jgi:hypothetical protein